MEILTMVILFVVGFVILIGGAISVFAFFFFKGKNKKFPFIMVNRMNPGQWKIYPSACIKDPKNKKNKVFFIKALGVTLDMKLPDLEINGVGHRVITHNSRNEINYASSKTIIDLEKEIILKKNGKEDVQATIKHNLILEREEKELALFHYEKADKTYEEEWDKAKLASLAIAFGFAFILLIGMIIQGVMLYRTSNNVVELAKERNKIAETTRETIQNVAHVAELQATITTQLASMDANIKCSQQNGLQPQITRTVS